MITKEVDVKAMISHIVRGDGADKCRICMGDTTEGQVYLGDTVMMDGDKPVTLAELLETITGVEMEISSTLPVMVCSECVTATLESAPFVLRCRDSCRKWTHLSDYLSNLQETAPDFTRAMCILVGEDYINTIPIASTIETVRKAYKLISNPRKRRNADLMKDSCLPKITKFECPECQQEFRGLYNLNKHLRDIGTQMCQYCGMVLNFNAFPKHLKMHGKPEFTCDNCQDLFKNETNYLKHLKVCKRKGSHVCIECSMRFLTAANLVTHHSSKHMQILCSGCRKSFKSKVCFKNHKKRCFNSENLYATFICDYCGKEYNKKTTLRLHIQHMHLIGWSFQCAQCGKKFASQATLTEHDNTHNPVEDRFVCDICSTKYSTRRGFWRHYKRHFDENGEVTVALRPHTRTPYKKKLYKCIICGFVSVKQSIQNHLYNKHHVMKWEEHAMLVPNGFKMNKNPSL